MPLTLTVDAARWRSHLRTTLDAYPGLVPVVKGNGYGFTNSRLAAETEQLSLDLLAVGTYEEVSAVRAEYSGDIVVLTPWRPGCAVPDDERTIHTVSRVSDLHDLLASNHSARVVVELLTSMHRHGLASAELSALAQVRGLGEVVGPLTGTHRAGWALHLPLPSAGAHGDEVETWLDRIRAAGLDSDTVFVSHLANGELAALRQRHPDLVFRPRIGTALWLGDRAAYAAHATVLDVHQVRRGDRFGYRQRKVPGNGYVVVVAGGTTHGISMQAPSHVGSMRERLKTVTQGSLEAAGRALSPYTVAGRRRWFVEPPHMQVSLLFVPSSATPPAVGDELDVNVGMTTTRFDVINLT